jgi:hypothetical protein
VTEQPQADKTLELDQDLAFQHRSWIVQRIGWIVLGLIIVAALLGLFGEGPLSHTTARTQDGSLGLAYNRFWRVQAAMTLRVFLMPKTAYAGEVRLWLSRSYVDAVDVQHITPQPQRVEAGTDRLTYVFAISQMGQQIEITFQVKPERPGRVAGRLGLEDGTTLSFAHVIYP